jgi:hypothetical protein
MLRPVTRRRGLKRAIVAALAVWAVLVLCPRPAAAQAQTNGPAEFSGEEVMLEGKPIIFIPGKATWDKAFPTLTEKFRTIAAFLRENKLIAAGPMMTIYQAAEKVTLRAGWIVIPCMCVIPLE